MDATCTIQDSIHVFSLVHKYVSRILGTYHSMKNLVGVFYLQKNENLCLTTMQYKCIITIYAIYMHNL